MSGRSETDFMFNWVGGRAVTKVRPEGCIPVEIHWWLRFFFILCRVSFVRDVYWLQNNGGYAYSFTNSYSNTRIVCELSGFVREGEEWSIRCVADIRIVLVARRA